MRNAERKQRPTAAQPEPQVNGSVTPGQEYRIPRFAELDAQIAEERAADTEPQKGKRTRQRKLRDGQKRPSPADPAIRAAVQAAADHRRDYRPDRETAERMVKTYRAALIPRGKPGSKALAETVKAADLYSAGIAEAAARNQPLTFESLCKLWAGIKRQAIPGFDAMDKYQRKWRGDELRRNVKAYLKRRGVKLPWPIRTQRKRKPGIA
jgi:hypothetical protein